MLHESLVEKSSDDVLKIENLNLKYNNKKILDDINISVKRGNVITILGPNGGGKTSLVKAITGINKNYTGNIIFAENIKISYMPQNFSINNLMPITVEYFLLHSFLKRIKKNAPIVEEVVELVGLNKLLNHQVFEISAGQMQLLLLARCLIAQPDLIILDEPVSAMDINARVKFYEIICEIKKKKSVSVFMTSHDLNSVVSFSNYIICINNCIYCQGKPEEIIEDKGITEIFSSYRKK
ncbi:metal ABC transporter ATP-binding protein [Wolbachia endosymbiont of Chironomus riparius]|uniref:metal ABC transporter ATP-binding protein n=1 Tax=Wolbachia endosymbiont of Chironomus riparius TaxID=2883238 RepID=UPI00209C8214|nr:metal ABC transporter ATP-binding protein [Wolbachia endosymbiont of Chironomus riparius]